MSDTRPNILMIVTDQEYSHQATTTVCTPSRSVMWTGQHTPSTGMFDNTNFAWIADMRADPEALPTIGHMLREQGFYTAYKGKWHLSEFSDSNTRDAMEPFGFSDYQTTLGWLPDEKEENADG